jgi:hypothetical protein
MSSGRMPAPEHAELLERLTRELERSKVLPQTVEQAAVCFQPSPWMRQTGN